MATNRKGVLITCDIPTMQVIKFMDKQEGGKMIIKELDERNVFIHKTFIHKIQTKMKEMQTDNHYER